MRVSLALALALVVGMALAAVPSDRITSLPGFTGTLPSPQYSGYFMINPQTGKRLHYWLVLSENKPSTDPVVFWFNGGPGCSSLDGFFYEHGPLHFANGAEQVDGVPQLIVNPYRWSQIATMVFVEAPAGVGFSYSNDANDYNTNDTQTAEDNYAMIQQFLSSYPEYDTNDIYIAGESYAGIYVPTLAWQVLQHNQAGQNPFVNLKGFMVGNGCTGNAIGSCSDAGTQIRVEFLFGHGLYSKDLHSAIMKECDFSNPSSTCNSLLTQMGDQVGDVNIYDIYGDCISGTKGLNRTAGIKSLYRKVPGIKHPELRRSLSRFSQLVGGPDECIDGIDAEAYLNNDAVRQAIHVANSSVVPQWTICTSNINYNSNTESLMPIYPTLIKNYRVLVFNGDVDACVPYTDNEAWTEGLGLPVSNPWRAWAVNSQVAGYVTEYGVNGFTFATVKGAGHMVPQYKPVQAFALFQRYLNNQPL